MARDTPAFRRALNRVRGKRRIQDQPYKLWRFQWPQMTNEERPMVLVYAEDRKNNILLDCTLEGLQPLFFGHPKFYAWARFDFPTQKFEFDKTKHLIYPDDPECPEW